MGTTVVSVTNSVTAVGVTDDTTTVAASTVSGLAGLGLYAGAVNAVTDYGAAGNGSTDDTTALANAIAAVPSGGVLYLPPGKTFKITSPLTLASAITVWGYGATLHQTTTSKRGLVVTGSGVTVLGLTLTGANSTLTVRNSEDAIYAVGASEAAALTDLVVRDCTFALWGRSAVWGQYLHRFDWSGNRIQTIGSIGLGGYSIQQGTITRNRIDTVGTTTSTYGVLLSRATTDSLTTDPRSADIAVAQNTVRNVTYWDGLNTHGGQRISWTGNVIEGCYKGIELVPCPNSSAVDTFAPVGQTVCGNVIESGVTDGSVSSGIVLVGAGTVGSVTEAATGTIVGNRVKGHGLQSNNNDGAILVYLTQGVTVADNSLGEPSPMGIAVYHDNDGLTVSGNSIVDPWSSAVTTPAGIAVRNSYNVTMVGGNTVRRGSKSATYVLVDGVRVDGTTGCRTTLAWNDLVDATAPQYLAAGSLVIGAETVSADLGDADYTAQCGASPTTLYFGTTLTADRAVTLSTTNAYPGARFRITRTGLGSHTLAVGSVKTIGSATAAFVDVIYQAGAWRLAAYGTL